MRSPRTGSALVAAVAALFMPTLHARAQTIPPVPTASAPTAPFPNASAPAPTAAPPSTYIVPSVTVLGTQTSNALMGTGRPAHSDTVLDVIPGVFLQSQHARWQLQGDIRLHGGYFAQGTNPDVLAPEGSAALHSEWVRNLLFLDANFNAAQSAVSPYVGQGGALQGTSYTTTQWRISPYIDRRLQSGLRFIARSDATWTRTSNAPSQSSVGGGRYLRQSAQLVQRPQRFGYAVEARQNYATYDSNPFGWTRNTSLRVVGDVAFATHGVFGLIGGRENMQAASSNVDSSIYGVRVAWNPGLYANLGATVEHRFYGTGWNLSAAAGTPRSRLSVNWQRDATSSLAPLTGSSTSALNPTANIGELLNALLVTQYPNPLERARAVQSLLGSAGLPAGLATSGNFYIGTTVLQNNLVLTGLLLRGRDSLALSMYRNRVQNLFLPGQEILQVLQAQALDTVQTGWALNYGHRLTPLANLNVTLQRELDTGFGINQGLSAVNRAVILQVDRRLSPRTTGLVGLRRRLLESTQVGGGNETAVFVGVVHRF